MSSHPFSTLIMRELFKEIEQIGENVQLCDEDWVEAMATKHHEAIQEHPVMYLTEKEHSQATKYLASYKESDIHIADRATRFIRCEHAAEIREFIKAKHNDLPSSGEHDSTEGTQYSFPGDNGAPTCFEEWFAVTQVWRLTLAMKEIAFQDAATGTPDCLVQSLPKPWEEKLNECLQITDDSAIVPAPRGYSLPLTRRDINSILPASDDSTNLSGLPSGTILERWFQILISHRNQRKRDSAVVIHSESLDRATTTPQKVTENALLANERLEVIFFPTTINEQEHCILAVAFPQKHVVEVYNSLGSKSTRGLQKNNRPWLKEGCSEQGKKGDAERGKEGCSEQGTVTVPWEVEWCECPPQNGEEDAACGIFTLINALFVCMDKDPEGGYSQQDVLFLRRYIAAVICMGELPPSVF